MIESMGRARSSRVEHPAHNRLILVRAQTGPPYYASALLCLLALSPSLIIDVPRNSEMR
jgi:hypothetical protein